MTQPFGGDDFRRLALEAFPKLREEFEDFAGLLHVQMGAFARRTQQAKGAADWESYARCIALIDHLWAHPDDELLNAMNVSFLEHIDFDGPRGPIAWGYLSPRLKHAWEDMQRYLEELARSAKGKGKHF